MARQPTRMRRRVARCALRDGRCCGHLSAEQPQQGTGHEGEKKEEKAEGDCAVEGLGALALAVLGAILVGAFVGTIAGAVLLIKNESRTACRSPVERASE